MSRREANDPTEAVLHLHRGGGVDAVPADVLARALIGVQQTALLIAAASEGHKVHERFRPSQKLRERATLLCELPTRGSYAVPMRLVDGQLQLPFGQDKTIGLMRAVQRLLDAVQRDASDVVHSLLPDSAIRAKVLQELARFLPQPGDPWAIGFSSHDHPETILDDRAVRVVEDWLTAELAPADTTMTVTGELARVWFDEKKIVIIYKPTQRHINCFLRDEVVNALLDHRSAAAPMGGTYKVQVTGKFTLDRNEHPKQLTDVYRVAPVDTSPMEFDKVRHKGCVFTIAPPLKLALSLDEESEQFYVATEDDLDLHVYAPTRDQVVEEVGAQLAFNWEHYALEQPEKLAKGALRLREALLGRVRVSDA